MLAHALRVISFVEDEITRGLAVHVSKISATGLVISEAEKKSINNLGGITLEIKTVWEINSFILFILSWRIV